MVFKVNILVDSGVSKCFMPKSFYPNHSYLHKLPKFTTKAASIEVRNTNLDISIPMFPIEDHKLKAK